MKTDAYTGNKTILVVLNSSSIDIPSASQKASLALSVSSQREMVAYDRGCQLALSGVIPGSYASLGWLKTSTYIAGVSKGRGKVCETPV